ncbi:hypothetical protein [Hoeflea prorocentri]|uniref:Uncharacterized protein n=1 Tax=Hoeflea prorocentri TaxID=1922333 RepID=A0A9X3UJE0_9HYPH|nr:hypothetical protein [Hoeflea prorocentri]MCY6381515.1 hypothetical protein [Hoeflea prorocentri]MDA5399315.1 hypothetical protein [Hoeflea prorocentri]
MADIIQLNSRMTPRRPRRPRNYVRHESATVLMFTGVRYETKQGSKGLPVKQSRRGKA